MNFEAVGLGVTFVGAVIGAVWFLGEKLSDIRVPLAEVATKVELILTNHLPHLSEDVKEISDEQKRLRDKLDEM